MASTTPVTEEAAAAMAKEFTKGIMNKKGEGKKAGRPRPIIMRLRSKPAWIKYYERSSTGATDYGRGYAKPYKFFEEQMMKEYTNSADQFLDLINQNPEACAILYPDASGKIRILHHLTATVHSHAIVIGVNGLGGTSEAKAITISTLSDQLSIGLMDGKNVVPKVKDFMEQSFVDITPGSVSTGLDGVPDEELGKFFDGFPTGYMIHPLWLTLLYEAIGQDPSVVADTLMGNLEMAFHEERAGFDEYSSLRDYYSEIHKLLVYLWGCEQGYIALTNRCLKFLTKTFDTPEFRECQNRIIRKSLPAPSVSPSDDKKKPEAGQKRQHEDDEDSDGSRDLPTLPTIQAGSGRHSTRAPRPSGREQGRRDGTGTRSSRYGRVDRSRDRSTSPT